MNNMSRFLLCGSILIGLLGSATNGIAQEVTIASGFLKDSIKIGEPTGYYLTARYPSNLTVLFPDSTFDFAPFEYEQKKYFPTLTNNSESFDSTIYYLTTFEIDSVMYLRLPVYQINAQDCTVINSPMGSILLTQLVAQVPDSLKAEQLPLKTNTTYQPVFFQFNYPIALIVLGGFVVLIIVIVFVFGKKIKRFFKIRRLRKNHRAFMEKYAQYLNMIGKKYDRDEVETLVFIWKKYLERLEAVPFTKLTTKETLKIIREENIGQHLMAVDRAIYGNHALSMDKLEGLLEYANLRFSSTLDQLQHG